MRSRVMVVVVAGRNFELEVIPVIGDMGGLMVLQKWVGRGCVRFKLWIRNL